MKSGHTAIADEGKIGFTNDILKTADLIVSLVLQTAAYTLVKILFHRSVFMYMLS